MSIPIALRKYCWFSPSDCLPPELYESWNPPAHLTRLLYATFMQSLGVLPTSTSIVTAAESNSHPSVSSTIRQRWHSDTTGSAEPLPTHNQSASTLTHLSVVSSSDSQFALDTESCLPFREIMDIDMALERSVTDQLPVWRFLWVKMGSLAFLQFI